MAFHCLSLNNSKNCVMALYIFYLNVVWDTHSPEHVTEVHKNDRKRVFGSYGSNKKYVCL